jgi:hypothetical protein
LGLSPLMEARGADASSVERVPLIAARAEPFVLFAGRPAEERAADARIGWLPGLLFVEFAIQNN